MRVEYDRDVDALYIKIQEKKVSHTKEIEEGINLNIDNDGKIIGLEIIGATERYSPKDLFNGKFNLRRSCSKFSLKNRNPYTNNCIISRSTRPRQLLAFKVL